MPVILATQEAKIRKIAVQGQSEQIVHKTLSQKYPTQNRAGGMAEVVGHLPNNHDALISSPSTTRKRKRFPVIEGSFSKLKGILEGLGCGLVLEHLPSMCKAQLCEGKKRERKKKDYSALSIINQNRSPIRHMIMNWAWWYMKAEVEDQSLMPALGKKFETLSEK
jgi:hypothetical protein